MTEKMSNPKMLTVHVLDPETGQMKDSSAVVATLHAAWPITVNAVDQYGDPVGAIDWRGLKDAFDDLSAIYPDVVIAVQIQGREDDLGSFFFHHGEHYYEPADIQYPVWDEDMLPMNADPMKLLGVVTTNGVLRDVTGLPPGYDYLRVALDDQADDAYLIRFDGDVIVACTHCLINMTDSCTKYEVLAAAGEDALCGVQCTHLCKEEK